MPESLLKIIRWGHLQSRWHGYIAVVPAAYRALAFAIGAAQIFFFPATYYSVIPALALSTRRLLKYSQEKLTDRRSK